ncbi:putative BTB/POZ domain-containing protein NPY2-like [Capsicum annuum]|uniref:uncharacterized protein LOC107849574 n=1 Tax=Capsicum annuum TaxID=4072 RepID=UPI001FB11488|nr:uncharacterized protein LOC107849574 [Capsicum annuum]KAF3651202.1 putative BTB/POZ domain-containing protein NPY2-like [Capsicum annuum]
MCDEYSLPRRYLNCEVDWDDDKFLPEGASKNYRAIFQTIYAKYFTQILESEGFDISIYPGPAEAAVCIPYLDFEKELDLLRVLAEHAIQEYNLKEENVYKYKFMFIETVNFIVAGHREFFMNVRVNNLTLRTPVEMFRIRAYRGIDGKNVVVLCQRKMFPPELAYQQR